MKRSWLVMVMFPVLAFAGKAERDYWKTEIEPEFKAAEAAYKKACGCDLKISIKEDKIVSTDDMYRAKHTAASIKDNAAGYCTDAESKKAVCKMKKLEITKGGEVAFTFSGDRGIATTDGQASPNFEMMTNTLDK